MQNSEEEEDQIEESKESEIRMLSEYINENEKNMLLVSDFSH